MLQARKSLLVLMLLFWPAFLGFGPPSLVESDDVRLPIGPIQLQELNTGRPPVAPIHAALILDLPTGRAVFQRNARLRTAPASITKVMTAIVALEQGDLQVKVAVVPEDLVEGSAMGLRAGDTVTIEQLLWGMLLPSGNDAAQALARALGGGSIARFVEMMNQKAQELKLQDTHFVNPHGLDEPNHYSTAYDLAQLSRYALRNPLFSKIVSTREYVVQANRSFPLQNTNQLLYAPSQVPGVNGVKTGFTDQAGDSLVASVERDSHRILVVVLGTPNRAAAAATLITYAYSYFTWLPVALLSARWGSAGALSPAVPTEVMVPAWQKYYVNYSVELSESFRQGPLLSPAGMLRYYLAGQELGRLPLYVGNR